jgi:hypothetical protein
VTSSRRQQPVDTAAPCHYIDDPARRPRCTLTATIQIGAVALCASCNAARSTLGKGQPALPLPTSEAFDVLGWVSTAHQQAGAAEATLSAAVTRARQSGASWSAIGSQLGLSRQGAQQHFTRASSRESTNPPTRASAQSPGWPQTRKQTHHPPETRGQNS